MTEMAERRRSKRVRVPVSELAYLVRVPNKPADARAFSADELGEANAYASETGGVVSNLD